METTEAQARVLVRLHEGFGMPWHLVFQVLNDPEVNSYRLAERYRLPVGVVVNVRAICTEWRRVPTGAALEFVAGQITSGVARVA